MALGINKQLDLQSAITEAGRVLSYAQGWHGQRRVVQLGFIFVISAFALASGIVLFKITRHVASATRLASLGAVLLLSFVVIRAASFHHFDRFIGERFLGLKWNWILEVGGIALILFASLWRHPEGLHLTFKDGVRKSTLRLRALRWQRLAENPVAPIICRSIRAVSVFDYGRFQLIATPMAGLLGNRTDVERETAIKDIASDTESLLDGRYAQDGQTRGLPSEQRSRWRGANR